MTILSDTALVRMHDVNAVPLANQMIRPFCARQVREVDNNDGMTRRKIISRGVSSAGYDVTLAPSVQIFTNKFGGCIDPKNFAAQHCLEDAPHQLDNGFNDFIVLPPHSYLLGHTVEHFNVPRDIMIIAVGKSTYARCGIHVNVTPIEPGFQGQVVIEISNATSLPAKIYLNEGIAQFLFLSTDQPCTTSYADRRGKYQGQTGITHART